MAEKIAEWRAEAGGPEFGAQNAKGLSALQRYVLMELRRWYEKTVEAQRQAQERGAPLTGLHAVGVMGSASWRRGVSWRDLRPRARPTWGGEWAETKAASERAALSRALRRLEERGLVERQNDAIAWSISPRSRSVVLTPAGWAVTDHLAGEQEENG